MSSLNLPAQVSETSRSIPKVQQFYWSVRRELWEHRSIYLAPLAVAAITLIGIFIHVFSLPALLAKAKPQLLFASYSAVAVVLMLTSVIVGSFYCLDALYGERRDRTILFWKSLPVSDTITVLAKASIPFVVLPIFTFALIAVVQLVTLALSTIIIAASGMSVANYWSQLPFVQMPKGVIYFLFAIAVWYAPMYGWFLLVSAWAQRAVFVCAVAPALALLAIEQTVLGSTLFTDVMKERFAGVFSSAFSRSKESVVPDPTKFFANHQLWIGLAIAIVLIYIVIKLRRRRDPL